jgi:hypothetical protein
LHGDTLVAFLRIVGLILLPLAIALAGLALLSSLVTAIIWVAAIVSITYGYLRFNAKHNEHEEYDDHPSQAKYKEGLRTYVDLIEKEKETEKNKTKPEEARV